MDRSIEIPAEEWANVSSIVGFAEPDERSVLAMVLLSSDGSRRSWWAMDSYRMAGVSGGSDDGTYRVLVSPRIIQAAVMASGVWGAARLSTSDRDGHERISVESPGLTLTISADPRDYPSPEELMAEHAASTAARVEVESQRLRELLYCARQRPIQTDPDEPQPLFWLGLDEGVINVGINWPDLGTTRYRLVGESGEGSVELAVSPKDLHEAVDLFDGSVSLLVAEDHLSSLQMTDGHRSALIRPIETGMERLRPRVESVLVEVFGPDVLHRDHDGDYLLNTVDGIQVCAQLVDGDAITLQIFGVLVSGVEKSHGLIEELNDYNTNIHFARVFWVSDQVLVEVDLLAATVDPEEVGTAFDRIAKFGRDLGPTVAAIYGGRLMVNDLAERWAGYHQATIIADTAPGVSVALNGPDATEQWPYPEAVHVLTAWNPGGRIRSSDANQQDGNRLASLLYENGYDFHRARGGLADYWEEGVAVWGLEQESARELGRQFGQDAIFEIDENECRVVGCFADRVDGRPRISRDPIASTEAD